MTTKKWFKANTKSLEGKLIAITGSTGGLGKVLCFYLANLGANLVLVDRNLEKSNALKERILKEFPSTEISLITADMEDFSSVKEATDTLVSLKPYAIILNAGAYSIPRKTTNLGFDNLFQINFVCPYYMAKKLMPTFEKNGGRVVAVGSIAHTYSKANPKDIDFKGVKANSKAYGNAKRFLMFSLWEVFEDKASPFLAITHPGITFTGITNHYPKLIFAIIKRPMKLIFMKPKIAALSILKGVFEPTPHNKWIGPRFFGIWGLPKTTALKTCSSNEQQVIFKTAEKIYKSLENKNSL